MKPSFLQALMLLDLYNVQDQAIEYWAMRKYALTLAKRLKLKGW